jgi:serine/threonine protein kinase
MGTLAELSKKFEVPMDEEWIMEVFVHICFGLSHLHKTRIIHRDLKLRNIFLDKNGIIKLWQI